MFMRVEFLIFSALRCANMGGRGGHLSAAPMCARASVVKNKTTTKPCNSTVSSIKHSVSIQSVDASKAAESGLSSNSLFC